jgi:hypothetical protein
MTGKQRADFTAVVLAEQLWSRADEPQGIRRQTIQTKNGPLRRNHCEWFRSVASEGKTAEGSAVRVRKRASQAASKWPVCCLGVVRICLGCPLTHPHDLSPESPTARVLGLSKGLTSTEPLRDREEATGNRTGKWTLPLAPIRRRPVAGRRARALRETGCFPPDLRAICRTRVSLVHLAPITKK